jgi:hypothetical protein
MDLIGIIGDIKDSRTDTNRRNLQEKLAGVLDELNRERKGNLTSPFTITLGDEFQVLYNKPFGLFADLWRIMTALHPAKVRFSIALGSLTTEINTEQALGMDGPVFHIARDGIERAKKLETTFLIGGSIPNLKFINDSLILISHVARDWNAHRLAIQANLNEGKPVKEIAELVRISESGVYKNIDAAALNTISEITKGIELAIEQAKESAA